MPLVVGTKDSTDQVRERAAAGVPPAWDLVVVAVAAVEEVAVGAGRAVVKSREQ
jgi:hypothetical protein